MNLQSQMKGSSSRRHPWRLYAVVLVVMLQVQLGSSVFGRNDCEKISLNSKCQCSLALGNYEIECPAGEPNPKLKIVLHPDLQVSIECYARKTNYTLLPKANVGNIPNVRIKDCPLPGIFPITSIFDHLGITNVKSLYYERHSFDINITRKHMEGLEGLRSLRLRSRTLTHFADDIFEDLKNLTWLDLNLMNNYPVDLFKPLENLGALELSYNLLKDLPRGIFRNQRKLHNLNLWSNRLHNLTKYTFEGASSIYALDLTANGIETFQPDVFEFLTNLSIVRLNANNIKHLPDGLFASNKNLTEVSLVHNRVPLKTLPSELLADSPKLKVVNFICGLENLPSDLFARSAAITNISLANNRLKTLPAELFVDQLELLGLDLHGNQLESLPDAIFAAAKNLKVLNLADNRLTYVSGDIFTSLIKLEYLYLEKNAISEIHNDAFHSQKNLVLLNMADNQLTDTEPIRDMIGLKSLLLHNNSIMYISSNWMFNFFNLEELDLSNNNITKITHTEFQFLSKHNVKMNLSKNRIVEIDLSRMADLNNTAITVDLNENPLDCNCLLLKFIQFLRNEIDLSNNYGLDIQLKTDNLSCQSPERLKGKNVKDLDPKELLCSLDLNSQHKKCPAGCECWVRTFDFKLLVNCSNSNFTRVPTLPSLVSNLKATELFVENNQIVKLPSINSPGYAQVSKIFAAGNNISKIEDFNLPQGLTHLDLSNNHLHYLNGSALAVLNQSTTLQSLKIAGNPFQCDCDATPLLIYTQNKYKIIEDVDEIKCDFPLHSKNFQLLSTNDLCPVDKSLVIAVAVVISLLGFLIGLVAALYFKYQLEIKIWLYAHNLCMWFVTEEELDKDKKYDGFVSYSHHDKEFVENFLVPQLENGNPPFKLCVHERDFVVGGRIAEQIVQNIDDSRRTIVILSKNFIESMWAKMEFQTAHKSALNEGRARVIVIIYGDIGDIEDLDTELKAYLKMNTYLKWGDPWFWDKLRYAMPHCSNKLNTLIKTPLKGSTDDKLELIKPSPVTPTLSTPPAEATKNPLVAHLNGKTPQTTIVLPNGKLPNFYTNGKITQQNGHVNGAFIINTNAKQSDV